MKTKISNLIKQPTNICLLAVLLTELLWAVYYGYSAFNAWDEYANANASDAAYALETFKWWIEVFVLMIIGALFISLYISFEKSWILLICIVIFVLDFFRVSNAGVNFSGIIICWYVLYSSIQYKKTLEKVRPEKILYTLISIIYAIYGTFYIVIDLESDYGYAGIKIFLLDISIILFSGASIVLIFFAMARNHMIFAKIAAGCFLISMVCQIMNQDLDLEILGSIIVPEVFLSIFLLLTSTEWIRNMNTMTQKVPHSAETKVNILRKKLATKHSGIIILICLGVLLIINITLYMSNLQSTVRVANGDLDNCYLTTEENGFLSGMYAFGRKTLLISAKDGKKYTVTSDTGNTNLRKNILYYTKGYGLAICYLDIKNKFHRGTLFADSASYDFIEDSLIYVEMPEEDMYTSRDYGNIYILTLDNSDVKKLFCKGNFYSVQVSSNRVIAIDDKNYIYSFTLEGKLKSKQKLVNEDGKYFMIDGMASNHEIIYTRQDHDNTYQVLKMDVVSGKVRILLDYSTDVSVYSVKVKAGKIYYFNKNTLCEYAIKTKKSRKIYKFETTPDRVDLFLCKDYIVAETDYWNKDKEERISFDYQGKLAFEEVIPKGASEKISDFFGLE